MQRLEVSGAVRPIYGSLGVKRLRRRRKKQKNKNKKRKKKKIKKNKNKKQQKKKKKKKKKKKICRVSLSKHHNSSTFPPKLSLNSTSPLSTCVLIRKTTANFQLPTTQLHSPVFTPHTSLRALPSNTFQSHCFPNRKSVANQQTFA